VRTVQPNWSTVSGCIDIIKTTESFWKILYLKCFLLFLFFFFSKQVIVFTLNNTKFVAWENLDLL